MKLNLLLSRRISHFFWAVRRRFCNPVWPWLFCLKLDLFVPWVIILACIVDHTSPQAGEKCAQKHPSPALPVSLPCFSTVFSCWSWPRNRYNYLLCLKSSTVLEKRVLCMRDYNAVWWCLGSDWFEFYHLLQQSASSLQWGEPQIRKEFAIIKHFLHC